MSEIAPSYAGFGTRFYAYLIDQSIIQGLALALSLPFGGELWSQLSGAFNVQPESLVGAGSLEALATSITMAVLFFTAIQFVLGMIYGTLMEASPRGATFGKRHCGLRVTDEQGGQIGYGAAALRNAGINILGVALAADFLIALLVLPAYLLLLITKKKQALHDLIAKTVVVRIK